MSTLLGPIGAAETYTRSAYAAAISFMDLPSDENANRLNAALDLVEAEVRRARLALTESERKVA